MDKLIDDLIKLAFAEDIGDGDHTRKMAYWPAWKWLNVSSTTSIRN